MIKRKIYVGTSGWFYQSWQNKFYPKKLKEEKLEYYSRQFNTVEVNYSFYKLPTKKAFKHWNQITTRNFYFSIKLSRYLTHVKKLKVDTKGRKGIQNFLNNAAKLENKLKVILIQLPGSFKFNPDRLEDFVDFFNEQLKKRKLRTKLAFEFRNDSWFNPQTYKILKKYKSTLVISDSPHYPFIKKFTSNFVYIRFHGPSWLYASQYSDRQLQSWKKTINRFPKDIKEVYIYFNNDYNAYAIEDAQYLKEILKVDN